MKNNQTFRKMITCCVATAAILVSCQKEAQNTTPAGKTNLSVYITDGPVNFDNAFIDIQMLEVKIESDSCAGSSHDSNDYNGGNSGSDDHGGNSGSDDHGGNPGSDDKAVAATIMAWIITPAVKDGIHFR